MAGQLTIDTLKASSGVLATQNGMTGIAKAWYSYNASTQTIRTSFNISSITRTATGVFVANFTTAMPSANYTLALSLDSLGATAASIHVLDETVTPTTTSFQTNAGNITARQNPTYLFATVFSA